jgi:ATP-dependent DNA helicase PIF1
MQGLQQEQPPRRFGVCAPTGVAAVNVGGSTLHAYFGIGLGTGSLTSLVKKVTKNTEATKRINETDILLIDEVSMVSSYLLETLDAVVREVRQDGQRMDEPFGGMKIVAVGDFFQLPPIVQGGGGGGGNRDQERPFCFDSYVWEELGLQQNTIELQQVQRQESGSKFELFLNMVRTGDVAPATIQDFNAKCLISPQHPLPADGIIPTRLYTHNRDVDQENVARLLDLEGNMVTCQATDEWREAMPKGTLASVKKTMKTSVAAEMPDEVPLKVGAQVMLTRNLSLERGLVNGSRGIVERFDKDAQGNPSPLVRFDNGIVEKIAKAEAIRYNPDGGAGCLVRKQVPLRLAWAVTVHKSQGSTLTRAILDISATFEPGQAYVSLSRVKSIDGLWLEKPVRMDNIMVSPRVLEYYRTIPR